MSDIDDLSSVFNAEVRERLAELSEILHAQGPEQYDKSSLDGARRAAHNLKGAALTVGVRPIAGICGVLEQEIQAVVESQNAPSPEQIATWLYLVGEVQGIVADPDIVRIQVAELAALSAPVDLGLCSRRPTEDVAVPDLDDVAARVGQVARIRQRLIERVKALQAFCDDAPRIAAEDEQPATGLSYHITGISDEVQALGVVLDEFTTSLERQRSAREVPRP